MDKRAEPEKNVSNTRLRDIHWCLTCADACAKTVKSLEVRMDSIEENMSVIKKSLIEEMSAIKKSLTEEMLEEFVRNKEKIEEEEEDGYKFTWWHPNTGKPNLH